MGKLTDRRHKLLTWWSSRQDDVDTASASGWSRWTAAVAVVLVGVIAGIVSFRHQYSLALGHGESLLTARLIPFSVDGAIVAGSVALLAASCQRRKTGWARVTVGAGITMTLFGNVAHGLAWGVTGVIVSAWAPVAIVLCTETLAAMLRMPKITQVSEPVETRTSPAEAPVSIQSEAALPPVPLSRPRLVTDSSVVRLKRDMESWEVKITPAIRAALEAGTSALKLTEAHPELGSKFRTQQLINEYQAGRIELAEHGEKASGE